MRLRREVRERVPSGAPAHAEHPAPPDRRVRLLTESGETVGSTSESNAERLSAALEPRYGPLTVVPA